LQPIAAALAVFLARGIAGLGVTHSVIDAPLIGVEAGTTDGGWRATAAEYLALYTPDTLANMPDDPSLRETELKTVGDKLALPLSVDKVALRFRRSPSCIIADNEGDRVPSFEERQGKNIVYWSKGGHAFMLIGNLPRATLEPLAGSLAARVG
jgi:hypothetical protein